MELKEITQRILLLMQHQQMTPSQFADYIGVQRSSMSHIVSGRNNPSLDFVLKILEKFPIVTPAWLLNGEGEFKANLLHRKAENTPIQEENKPVKAFQTPQNASKVETHQQVPNNTRTSLSASNTELEERGSKANQTPLPVEQATSQQTNIQTTNSQASFMAQFSKLKNKQVAQIVVFYTDRTFDVYLPD